MNFMLSPYWLFAFVLAILVGSVVDSSAQQNREQANQDVPWVLSYQGVLADHYGNAVSDGEYLITMRIYDTANGGEPLWEEQIKVTTSHGYFDTYLGLNKPLDIPFNDHYWLAAAIEGEGEMEPRTRLVASPYAMRAVRAEEAEGLRPGAYGAVTRLNGVEGELTIVGGGGISVKRSGDTIQIISSVSGTMASDHPGCLPRAVAERKQAIYHTEEPSGIIKLTMGGGDLGTHPPVAGEFQDLGSITISNPYVTTGSVVHVTILDKWDEGQIPDPCASIYMADVSNRAAGTFIVRIGMVPTMTSETNYQEKDAVYLGYSIVNPAR